MDVAAYPSFLNSLAPSQRTPCFGRGNIFISKDGTFGRARVSAARELCAGCPVRQACEDWAVKAGEPDGIWGGLTPRDRAELRSARSRDRHDCGTETAWRAHLSRGESCVICREAHDDRLRADRLTRLEREHRQHGGSLAGYRLELLLGMPTCTACRAVRQAYYEGRTRTPKWYRPSALKTPAAA
ncbi:WhiB family transcriptional regulator [Streptomyces sp. NPDC048644]|uniref:WhiB family transcriptional regulator n=1 Tax=Streptomyces sp. NPDC048644 TaxID=3365582 RepID=UPI00371C77EE